MNHFLHCDNDTSALAVSQQYKSCCSELSKIRAFMTATFQAFSISESISADLVIAVDEAVTNIIKHGYDNCSSSYLNLFMEMVGKVVHISITDNGRAFDMRDHPELDLESHIKSYAKGGLGVHIIKNLVDTIEYTAGVDGKNENLLKLTKSVR